MGGMARVDERADEVEHRAAARYRHRPAHGRDVLERRMKIRREEKHIAELRHRPLQFLGRRREVDAERGEQVGAAHFEVMPRLPCFITGTPALASTNTTRLEILNPPAWSPPVPTMSMARGAQASRPGSTDMVRKAAAKAATSAAVSPLSASAVRNIALSMSGTSGVASPCAAAVICSSDKIPTGAKLGGKRVQAVHERLLTEPTGSPVANKFAPAIQS